LWFCAFVGKAGLTGDGLFESAHWFFALPHGSLSLPV
jgi:hypothetical protein